MQIDQPDAVLSLEGVTYRWKESGTVDMGFIAQDVEKVFPAIVHERQDGYKTIDYVKLLPPIVELLKEQQNRIAVLEQELAQRSGPSQCR